MSVPPRQGPSRSRHLRPSTRLCAAVLVCCLGFSIDARAQQPLPEGARMPPGHPPVGASPAEVDPPPSEPLPPGHPPVSPVAEPPREPAPPGHPPVGTSPPAAEPPGEPLPPGHPPVAPSPDPHGGAGSHLGAPPANRVVEAPELGAGTVEIVLQDGSGAPQPGLEVVLRQHHHNVAEGDSITELRAGSDASGRAKFSGLPRDTTFSFTAHLTQGVARYRSPEFQVHDGRGRRVFLYVYPTVRELGRALVGMRGIVLLEPREDVIQVEMSYQVFNIGRTTWVPDGTSFALPPGAKAFRARESTTEATVEQRGDRIHFVGTYPPGQQDIAFSFQLPTSGSASQSLGIAVPPNLVEVRVGAAIARSATLAVAGFQDARHVRNADGSWVALTGHQLTAGDRPLERLEVHLTGLGVPARGRWIALGLAAALASLGLGSALSRSRGGPERRPAGGDTEHARELLFAELVALDRLLGAGRIGPRTHERNQTALIDALARLEFSRGAPADPGPR
jgi:hypothetical protein